MFVRRRNGKDAALCPQHPCSQVELSILLDSAACMLEAFVTCEARFACACLFGCLGKPGFFLEHMLQALLSVPPARAVDAALRPGGGVICTEHRPVRLLLPG